MSRDRYKSDLQCPSCGKTGVARISENDGWSYMRGQRDRNVDEVPEGFTLVDHGRNYHAETIFKCECGSIGGMEPRYDDLTG